MAYDTTTDAERNPNTAFVQPAPAVAPPAGPALPVPGSIVRDAGGEYREPTTYGSAEADRVLLHGNAPPTQAEYDAANNGGPALPGKSPPELSPPTGTQGSPPSALPAAQSEPTPHFSKPPIDPRPYAWLAEHNPQYKATIDEAAQQTGVSPERIAWHIYTESKFNPNVGRGAAGEIGMAQFMPGTAKEYDQGGKLNPADPHDAALMAALYARDLDAKYGKDSFLSVAHYNGSGERAYAYATKAFDYTGNFDANAAISQAKTQARGGSMTPQGLVKAGTEGGPDGLLNYAVQTAPTGMPLSDAWRHAEGLLVQAFIQKGDLAGAQHARDFILQMSHTGSNQYLMAAHQMLSAGDGVGAAQALAKAHAFFPDGTIGRFSSDGRNVYGERLDENDPSRKIGPSIHVTPQGIASLLNQTSDPAKYLATLNAQQKSAADTRLATLHGDYYAGLSASRKEIADNRNKTAIDVATIRADATANKPNNALAHQANQDADARYSELTQPDVPLAKRALMAEIHKDVMMNGATGTQAERVARGLSDRTLQLIRLPTGNYGVTTSGQRQPIAYLSQSMGDRLAPPQTQAATPVGAGVGTAAAAAAGVNSNLAGTSSALPVGAY